MNLHQLWKDKRKPILGFKEVLKYIGPGLLVTVGFVDPGNWASNIAAGSRYGYTLLWMVTLSTLILIVLQHNAAHLGIVTGKCLAEAATKWMGKKTKNFFLTTAMMAAISTGLAEMLGGAVALEMLFAVPLKIGALVMLLLSIYLQFTNSYRHIEKIIIFFVSIIGLAFLAQVGLIPVDWGAAGRGWVTPAFPDGSIPIIMSVLGAVVMPHNLFIHSEVIQSRQFNTKGDAAIRKELRFEYMDTIFSMIVGWIINSAIIFVAASTFFANGVYVDDLAQAGTLLTPMLGSLSATLFGVALLFAGIASSLTSAMAGGIIFAGSLGEPYDSHDNHTRFGSLLTMIVAYVIILLIDSPFEGLIYSQVFLSMQLPFTIFTQLYLTSSKKVMGKYSNGAFDNILLWIIGIIVTALNMVLLWTMFNGN